MNGTRRAVAVFAIVMGALLLGTWAILFVLSRPPEPWRRRKL